MSGSFVHLIREGVRYVKQTETAHGQYGSPKQMPFDIEHHRLTPYSLKEKSKGEAKRYIRDIIQATVENLLNNGLRVKPHFSNIRVGAYNAESKELCTSLVPWSIQTGQAFRNYKHAVIAECMSL